jgi:hypothetical protein
MAGLSTLLVVFRWFKGGQKKKEKGEEAETSAELEPEKPQDDEGKKTDPETPGADA